MKTPAKIVIRYFAILALAFVVGSFVIRPLMKTEKPKGYVTIAVGNEPFDPNTAPRFKTLAEANDALSASNYIHTNSILGDPGFKVDTLPNDPYVIVFRAIEARYTSDTNGPSTYTAYVPNGPALQMVYTNQASPAVYSITLYMTNLTAFSNRLTIY
jgi:hypothetical protein